jgi:hypothetical protein
MARGSGLICARDRELWMKRSTELASSCMFASFGIGVIMRLDRETGKNETFHFCYMLS